MVTYRVVLDACVLLPQTLNDLVLTLAEAELLAPVWSPELLNEVRRNLCGPRFGKTAQQADRRVANMRSAFPHAELETSGYEALIPAMTNDPKDRHVLAAAVRAGATLIVTANLTDFPSEALEPFGIEAVHPDDFLRDQFEFDPQMVLACMSLLVLRNRLPPRSVGELLGSLDRLVPQFVTSVRGVLVAGDPDPDAGLGSASK